MYDALHEGNSHTLSELGPLRSECQSPAWWLLDQLLWVKQCPAAGVCTNQKERAGSPCMWCFLWVDKGLCVQGKSRWPSGTVVHFSGAPWPCTPACRSRCWIAEPDLGLHLLCVMCIECVMHDDHPPCSATFPSTRPATYACICTPNATCLLKEVSTEVYTDA